MQCQGLRFKVVGGRRCDPMQCQRLRFKVLGGGRCDSNAVPEVEVATSGARGFGVRDHELGIRDPVG